MLVSQLDCHESIYPRGITALIFQSEDTRTESCVSLNERLNMNDKCKSVGHSIFVGVIKMIEPKDCGLHVPL